MSGHQAALAPTGERRSRPPAPCPCSRPAGGCPSFGNDRGCCFREREARSGRSKTAVARTRCRFPHAKTPGAPSRSDHEGPPWPQTGARPPRGRARRTRSRLPDSRVMLDACPPQLDPKAAGFPPQDQDLRAGCSHGGRYRPACATGRRAPPAAWPCGPSTSSNSSAKARVRCR